MKKLNTTKVNINIILRFHICYNSRVNAKDNDVKVSIITPLFNVKNYFEETFHSVVSQTYKNFEWIIVDDMSTDGSYELAKELALHDKRIILLTLSKKGGPAKARNFGLKTASGRYITFLDSDDLLDANYLEEQVAFMKENGPLITAGYRRLAAKTTTDFMVPKISTYKMILNGNNLSCLTTMYDRTAIGENYFPEDFSKAEDYVFWLNILKKGYAAKGNQKILASYRILPNSRSKGKMKQVRIMYHTYHKILGINWFASCYHVVRWAMYGLKKYRRVK